MVTVSSAFISSRRERISFRVLSASGCAFKAAAFVDVLLVLDEPDLDEPDLDEPDLDEPDLVKPDFGKTDLDNTDVARDHSFHCIANAESGAHGLYYACGVNGFNLPVTPFLHFQLPSGFLSPVEDRSSFMPVRNTHAGARWSASRAALFS